MRYRFDNAFVGSESMADKFFAVTCYGTATNFYSVLTERIYYFKLFFYELYGISFVRTVKRVEDRTVVGDENEFCCRASAVYAQPCVSDICIYIFLRYGGFIVSLNEIIVFFF